MTPPALVDRLGQADRKPACSIQRILAQVLRAEALEHRESLVGQVPALSPDGRGGADDAEHILAPLGDDMCRPRDPVQGPERRGIAGALPRRRSAVGVPP
jgi:hypothetical protein